MTLPTPPSLFAAVERWGTGRNPAPELRLLDGSTAEGAPIALEQARRMLFDRSVDPAVRAALWRQIAERQNTDEDRSDWPLAVVWLGLPGLRRTASKISWCYRAERGDVEAELVTCYLEALAEVAEDTHDPGGQVLGSACSRAWTLWRKARPEVVVGDSEHTGVSPIDAATESLWQADYDPPASRSGLSASLRITAPAHRVEGMRIGALAGEWGLTDTATDTRYSGRGRRVATISLRVRRKG